MFVDVCSIVLVPLDENIAQHFWWLSMLDARRFYVQPCNMAAQS